MKARRDVFQAIADPTRRAILVLLAAQSLTPGVITASFHFSQQTISKHIQILTECELLTREFKGREIYYELNPVKMKEVADWLKPFQQIWESRFSKLDNILKKRK